MCFRMRRGPANGWLRRPPVSADGAYISHIYMRCLFRRLAYRPGSLLPPPSSAAASSLHLHAFIHSSARRWAKAIEGETLLSGVWPSSRIGRRFWRGRGSRSPLTSVKLNQWWYQKTQNLEKLKTSLKKKNPVKKSNFAQIHFQISLLKYDLFVSKLSCSIWTSRDRCTSTLSLWSNLSKKRWRLTGGRHGTSNENPSFKTKEPVTVLKSMLPTHLHGLNKACRGRKEGGKKKK